MQVTEHQQEIVRAGILGQGFDGGTNNARYRLDVPGWQGGGGASAAGADGSTGLAGGGWW